MIRNYIKVAVRNLIKHKQFAMLNVLGLSFAIAAAIGMLLYVEDELSYDKFHPAAERLHRLVMKSNFQEKAYNSAWTPGFIGSRMKKDLPEVENFATLYKHFKGFAVKVDNEEIPVNDVYFSSPNFFQVFGFELLYARPDKALASPENIVIHEQLADRLFPGQSVIGNTIETSVGTKKITGIIRDNEENSHFTPQVLVSLIGRWDIKDLSTIASQDATFYNYILLNKGSKIDRQKVNNVGDAYFTEWINAEASRKESFKEQKMQLELQRVTDIHLDSNYEFEMEANGKRSTVNIFALVAVLILVVASVNYMNLASARYLERMKELGIRKVLGSGRRQLAMHYFTESLVITTTSALLGFLLVQFTLPIFNMLSGKSMEMSHLFELRIMIGLVAMTVGSAIFSSLYPALFISNIQPVSIFSLNRGTTGSGSRFRKAMLVFQIATSGILLIFTFVVFQQLQFMCDYDLGFDKDQVMVLDVKGREARTKIPVLKAELLKLSSVKHVGLTGQVPGNDNLKTEPMGFESNTGEFTEVLTNYMFTGSDILHALDLSLAQGRNFDDNRGGANRGQEVIVNQRMVEHMNWEDAIGKKVRLPIGEAQVVGVVEDFHLKSLHHQIEPLVMIYLDNWAEALLVKVSAEDISKTISEISDIQSNVLTGVPFQYSFLDDKFAKQYQADEQKASLFLGFSVLTIIIACLGMIGLIGFSMVRRSKEMSIRRLFGASIWKVTWLFMKEYGNVVIIGLLIAVVLSNYIIKEWLINFPYKLDLSYQYYLLPSVLLMCITIVIVVWRTVRSSNSNPADVLRGE